MALGSHTNGSIHAFSLRTATWLGAALAAAGLLGTAGCSSSGSPSASASTASHGLTVKQLALGTLLKHSYQPGGKGPVKTEALAQPDDLAALGGKIYVGWQNGIGPQGEPSGSGNLDSTITEFTPAGHLVKEWNVTGKIDGMGADTATGQIIATVNEDAKSSLYTLSGGTVTHYTYSKSPLPQFGGTDGVSAYQGKILISASSPGTTGKAPASAPAVFAVTLNSGTKTATVAPFFADNAAATTANGGKPVTLALTDPDSNMVVPASSPEFAGDFMLNAQADQELIFSGASGQNLKVLKISQPVDDTAWVTSASGTLYTTDSTANTVDAITGSFKPGTVYTAVAPCNAASAPSVCPVPPTAGKPSKYGPDYMGMINMKTGAVSKVTLNGIASPKGMIFVP